MVKELRIKIEDFNKALSTLEEALREPKCDLVRDSVIKRFEYSFDLAWKSAKIFLDEEFGVAVFSPKECFRSLCSNQIISSTETEGFIQMTDDRNEVVHTYREELANELYKTIASQYVRLLRALYQKLQK